MADPVAILDLDTMEMIAPVKEEVKKEEPKKEEPKAKETELEVEEEIEETEEQKEEEEPAKEDKSEEEESDEEKEKEDEEPIAELPEEYKELLEENEIESVEELKTLIDGAGQLLEKVEELEEENARLKSEKDKGPFKNDFQKKAFEFIKDLNPSHYGEGLQTFAKIASMDLDTTDPKLILEEAFVLDHPELTRDEAVRKFGKQYDKKYNLKATDFESEEAYKEELEDRKIDQKSEVAKAKKILAAKKEEFKIEPEKEKEEAVAPKIIEKGIERYTSELDEYFKGNDKQEAFNSIVFSFDEKNPDANFTYNLSKDQLKTLKSGFSEWLKRPSNYNEKGEIGDYDLDQKAIEASFALFGADIVEKALEQGKNLGNITKVDEISKKKPVRKEATVNGSTSNDPMKQFEIMATKKAAKTNARG